MKMLKMGCQRKNKAPGKKNATKQNTRVSVEKYQNYAVFSGLKRWSSSWVILESGQKELGRTEERVGL